MNIQNSEVLCVVDKLLTLYPTKRTNPNSSSSILYFTIRLVVRNFVMLKPTKKLLKIQRYLALRLKLFSCSTQLSTKFQLLVNTKYRQIKKFPALSLSGVVFIMLINVKMPTIVDILTFMSRIKLHAQLSWVWKKLYNLGAWPRSGKKIVFRVEGLKFLKKWGRHFFKIILSGKT